MPESESTNALRLRRALPALTEQQIVTESKKLFPITSRTLIQHLRSEDPARREVSLARFCTLYYPAIYGFARLRGLDVEDAKDRTQDFFVEVVRDGLLAKFDPGHGTRLSSWLMTCFKNLDLNHRAQRSTAKRGGGREHVSYDGDFAEQAFQMALTANLPEASSTDLMLALGFWQQTTELIHKRHAGRPDEALVKQILPYVLEERWPAPPAPSQTEVAAQHGTTAVRLKAFFNRTLVPKAERYFEQIAREANPGINNEEVRELWALLRAHHGR